MGSVAGCRISERIARSNADIPVLPDSGLLITTIGRTQPTSRKSSASPDGLAGGGIGGRGSGDANGPGDGGAAAPVEANDANVAVYRFATPVFAARSCAPPDGRGQTGGAAASGGGAGASSGSMATSPAPGAQGENGSPSAALSPRAPAETIPTANDRAPPADATPNAPESWRRTVARGPIASQATPGTAAKANTAAAMSMRRKCNLRRGMRLREKPPRAARRLRLGAFTAPVPRKRPARRFSGSPPPLRRAASRTKRAQAQPRAAGRTP